MLLALLCTVPHAIAQPTAGTPSASGAPGVGSGEVAIELEQFGVGGARVGGWAGVRLRLFDTAQRSRTVLVRIAGRDTDGDTPMYERAVTLNPGVWQGVWIYAWLASSFGNDAITVTVHAAEEREGDRPPGVGAFRPGRMLGEASLLPPRARVIPASEIVYGVVGTNDVGLSRYTTAASGMRHSPYAHELTTVLASLTPESMPDAWMGLAAFDTIVWTAGDPAALGTERAAAIRAWVRRGGHLVVVLPTAGQEWTRSINNELAGLLPRVDIRRIPGVPLEPYRYLLTTDPDATLPASTVVQSLTPMADATPAEASELLAGDNGTCVVAQRLVGVGAVTLVGLPLTTPSLAEAGLPEASVFWNRVLGRRGEFVSGGELAFRQTQAGAAPSDRVRVVYDADLSSRVAKTGRAAVGVLLGFAVFVAYWLIAGPLGFAITRATGRARHAWVAFVAVAGLFTAIAWGGATLLRPRTVDANHFTIIDHVFGQPVQRARSWVSVLIPFYGEASIAVGAPAPSGAVRGGVEATLAPWDGGDASTGGGFPDVRPYAVAARQPSAVRVPVRSTVKRLVADWSAGPIWRMPRPTLDDAGVGAVRLRDRDAWRNESVLEGTLVHELPAALENVLIVAAPGQTALGRPLRDNLVTDARAFKLPRWEPGTPLDLAAITKDEGARSLLSEYLRDLTPTVRSAFAIGDATGVVSPGVRLQAISFFASLTPPPRGQNIQDMPLAAARTHTQGLDLSRWLTRPCLIIVGTVSATGPDGSPVRMYVEGNTEPVPTDGTTLVRWVYPLDAAPPPVRVPSGLLEGNDSTGD